MQAMSYITDGRGNLIAHGQKSRGHLRHLAVAASRSFRPTVLLPALDEWIFDVGHTPAQSALHEVVRIPSAGLRPESEDVLLICYGCGVTSGRALLTNRRLKRIDIVDISREVFDLAAFIPVPTPPIRCVIHA